MLLSSSLHLFTPKQPPAPQRLPTFQPHHVLPSLHLQLSQTKASSSSHLTQPLLVQQLSFTPLPASLWCRLPGPKSNRRHIVTRMLLFTVTCTYKSLSQNRTSETTSQILGIKNLPQKSSFLLPETKLLLGLEELIRKVCEFKMLT